MGQENKLPRGQAERLLQLINEAEHNLKRIENGEITEECVSVFQVKFMQIFEMVKRYDLEGRHTAREFRNQIAHSDNNDLFLKELPNIKNAFEKLKKNKRKCGQIINKDSKNKDKRRFERYADSKRFGNKETRKKTVNALEDSFNNSIDNNNKSVFPSQSETLSKTVSDISEEVKKYIGDHQGLSNNVQADILNWSQRVSTVSEILTNGHFQKERNFLEKIKKSGGVDFFDNFEQFESEYYSIETADKSFEMQHYRKLLQEDISKLGDKPKKEDLEDFKNAYFQALVKSLTKNFNTRKASYEQKLIDEKRKKFLKELYEKIEKFKRLEQLLQPIIDDLGRGYLWDLSNQPFQDYGFDILKKYAALLKNDSALQEFAELLGKQSATAKEVEKKIIEEITISREYHPQPAQRGNVVGFEYSNEISRVLPSETALLIEPDLEGLFYMKFVEKRLLSYRYSQNIAETLRETHLREIEVTKSKNVTGPIIICVDTSGSMRGVPEQTAKIATFALAKIAMRQRRSCFLISFSTGIETLDMSAFKKTNALGTLVDFLNKSFNGGTDAQPALYECLRQLKTEEYKNADVLLISDFVMKKLSPEIVSEIKRAQSNGTFFYSLVVGDSANNSAIECFDENINYNPYDEYSRREFQERIRKIRYKRNTVNSV